jgi:hypothetical protein
MVNRTTSDPENRLGRTTFNRDGSSIGPSDSSDSGSDLAGENASDDDMLDLDGDAVADTDAEGTGERLTAGQDPDVRIGSDIGLDRIVGAEDAGLGGGLDQAEEAQLGITDEELAELARTARPRGERQR